MPDPGPNSEPVPVATSSADTGPFTPDFRWQALFQRTCDALFVLNRRRRFLFVNSAWEKQTRLSGVEVRGLACVRRPPMREDPWDIVVRSLCCPPPEVLKGRTTRMRRFAPGPPSEARCWVIDFTPLMDSDGLLAIIGKLTVPPLSNRDAAAILPDKLLTLGEEIRIRYGIDSISAPSSSAQLMEAQIRAAAEITVPVLIWGEPGTGKQWVARVIHGQASQCGDPFVAVDCQKLPGHLIGELCFAPQNLPRTVYLKEPQSLPRDDQLKLAEAIRGNELRVLAGCSLDPLKEVASGNLLQELYGALAIVVMRIPPLRERRADLPHFVQRLLPRANASQAASVTALAPAAWAIVDQYAWPGNLRELYHAMQGACSRARGESIAVEDFPAHIRLTLRMASVDAPPQDHVLSLDQILEMTERRLIVRALASARGNRSRAAELLSIWRPRLLRRMQALGVEEQKKARPEE
jgi:transcriptional regulator with PAS, ATPase and Fis domain